MSASAVSKYNAFTKLKTIRCASLSDRIALRALTALLPQVVPLTSLRHCGRVSPEKRRRSIPSFAVLQVAMISGAIPATLSGWYMRIAWR